ncbi:MAG TPA: PEP-CTERM sorting domain-containing protein [Pirellulales bacterium]|jgi:hypothetical protein
MNTLRLLSAFVSLLALHLHVKAASIGVNFSTDPIANFNYDLAPTDVTGVVPQGNWNNAHQTDASLSNLIDDQGNSTGASLTAWNHSPTTTTVPTGTPTGDLLHEGDAYFGNGSIQVTNIPYATYDVYAYIAGGLNGSGQFFANSNSIYDNNGTLGALSPLASFIPPVGSDYGNYIYFAGLTGPSLTLSGIAITGTQSHVVFDGFQIVQTPEPSSVILLGFGAMWLVGTVLRRARSAN